MNTNLTRIDLISQHRYVVLEFLLPLQSIGTTGLLESIHAVEPTETSIRIRDGKHPAHLRVVSNELSQSHRVVLRLNGERREWFGVTRETCARIAEEVMETLGLSFADIP